MHLATQIAQAFALSAQSSKRKVNTGCKLGAAFALIVSKQGLIRFFESIIHGAL